MDFETLVAQGKWYGAAYTYVQNLFGGPTLETDVTVSVGTNAIELSKGNGDKLGLVIVNLNSVDMFVAPDPNVSSSLGIRLGANGGAVTMDVTKDFTLPSRSWWGVMVSAPSGNVFVVEYIKAHG